MPMPLVTVAIPTHNRAELLREAVVSVLKQSLKEFSVLIADNCSSGDTEAVVKSFGDRRIRYCKHKTNIGMPANWWFALTTPDTRYVALLNDDDLWESNHLERALAALEEYPTADMYSCSVAAFGSCHDSFKPWWLLNADRLVIIGPQASGIYWLRGNQISSPSVVLKRSALNGQALTFEAHEWGFDYILFARVALNGDWIFDPVCSAKYRWHDQMATQEWISGNRGGPPYRYAMRHIAEYALSRGVLNIESLIASLRTWPVRDQANIIVALSSLDTNPVLRSAARRVFEASPILARASQSSGHCRLAGRIGAWYLSWADILDRLRVGWWPRA